MSSPTLQGHRPTSYRKQLRRVCTARDVEGLEDWCVNMSSHRHGGTMLRKALFHTLACSWDEGARHVLNQCTPAQLDPHWLAILHASLTLPRTAQFHGMAWKRAPAHLGAGWAMLGNDLAPLRAFVARGASSWHPPATVVTWLIKAGFSRSSPHTWASRNTPTLRDFPLSPRIAADDPLHAWLHQPPPSLGYAIEGVRSSVLGDPDSKLWRQCLRAFPGQMPLLTEAWNRWCTYALPKVTPKVVNRSASRQMAYTIPTIMGMLHDLVAAGWDLDAPQPGTSPSPRTQLQNAVNAAKLDPADEAVMQQEMLRLLLPAAATSPSRRPSRL